MASARVGLVTGANKGVGFGIVRQLALQYPRSALGAEDGGSLLIYLAARDTSRGEAAVKSLHDDDQLMTAGALGPDGGYAQIKLVSLDIAQNESIHALRDFLAQEHPGGLDFVINNAGIALVGFDTQLVETTLRCNYHGTLEATRSFLPLLKPQGRLVNVASISGALKPYPPTLRQRFVDAAAAAPPSPTDQHPEDPAAASTRLMDEFADAVRRGKHEMEGWPSAAYAASKAGVIAMTKAIAAVEKARGSQVLINACCPGWVNTDMTRGKGEKSIDEGAQTPVMLAIGDFGGETGEFWRDGKHQEW